MQIDYLKAYQTIHGGPQRDLFDPGVDQWWYEPSTRHPSRLGLIIDSTTQEHV
jgi:hypothetical protein